MSKSVESRMLAYVDVMSLIRMICVVLLKPFFCYSAYCV